VTDGFRVYGFRVLEFGFFFRVLGSRGFLGADGSEIFVGFYGFRGFRILGFWGLQGLGFRVHAAP
jgi:hypothetical protein